MKGVFMVSEISSFLSYHGFPSRGHHSRHGGHCAREDHAAAKFAEDEGMRLPESVFLQTVTGDYRRKPGTP